MTFTHNMALSFFSFFFFMRKTPLLQAGCDLSDSSDWLGCGAAFAFAQVQELRAVYELIIAADSDTATESFGTSVCSYVHNLALQIAVHVIIGIPRSAATESCSAVSLARMHRTFSSAKAWANCLWRNIQLSACRSHDVRELHGNPDPIPTWHTRKGEYPSVCGWL